jgi:arsenate reductase
MRASKNRFALTIIVLLSMATTSMAQQKADKTILFICEHGSAKSIVAAAHFNRIAESNGIHIEAISRGTNPDEVVPDKINRLLEGDGFPAHNSKPVRLTPADLNKADYVVSFSVLPPSFGNPVKVESWNIPSFEAGYPAARDSIIHSIERLLRRIDNENKK